MQPNTEESKGGNIFQAIGAIILAIAIFLIMASLGLIPGFPTDENFMTYGMFLIIAAFFIIFLSVFTGLNRGIKKLETFTTLKCENTSCKQYIIRDFRPKDFIFKELEENCPKCNSKLYISDISSRPTKNIKEKSEKDTKPKKPKYDKEEKKFKTITTLKCKKNECDYIKTRDFQINDYVFKSIDDNFCSKCGSSLYISDISHKIPEKKK